jgi:hypothetical protein
MKFIGDGISNTTISVKGNGGIDVRCNVKNKYCEGYELSSFRLYPASEKSRYGIKFISGMNSIVIAEIKYIKIGYNAANISGLHVVLKRNGILLKNDTAESIIKDSFMIGQSIDRDSINITTGAQYTEGIILSGNTIYNFTIGIFIKDSFVTKVVNNFIDNSTVLHTEYRKFSNGIVALNSMKNSFTGNWIKGFERG